MSLIPAFCPSRNRASQLWTLLESISTNCPDTFNFTILVKADNELYQEGYNRLVESIQKHDHPYPAEHIRFVKETNSGKNFYDWLNQLWSKYMALYVDDCIFYRPLHPPENEIQNILDYHSDVWNVTLRVGKNTDCHCYQPGQELYMKPLVVKEEISGMSNITPSGGVWRKYIKWNYEERDQHENYGFAWGWDGIIFRTEEYKNILNNVPINNLRDVEHNMNNGDNRKKISATMPYMVCPQKSCVFSAQFNCTHEKKGYYGGVTKCEADEFNRRFLNGEVMDWQNMGLEDSIRGCHWEPKIKWRNI